MACTVMLSLGRLKPDEVVVGCDYNHAKSGNVRRGHRAGYALCTWHHRRHPIPPMDIKATSRRYGPSLMDGSSLFHMTYGSDDDLIALQSQWIRSQAEAA